MILFGLLASLEIEKLLYNGGAEDHIARHQMKRPGTRRSGARAEKPVENLEARQLLSAGAVVVFAPGVPVGPPGPAMSSYGFRSPWNWSHIIHRRGQAKIEMRTNRLD
jgi:hypothetical protein